MKIQETVDKECLGLNSMSCYQYRGPFFAGFALRVQGLITATSYEMHGPGRSHGCGDVVQPLSVALPLSQLLFSPAL